MESNGKITKELPEERKRLRKTNYDADTLLKHQKEVSLNSNYIYGKYSLNKNLNEQLAKFLNQTLTKEKLKQIASNSIDPAVLSILEQMVSTFHCIGLDDDVVDITENKYLLEQYEQLFHKVTLNVFSTTSCLDLYTNVLTNDIVTVFRMEIDEEKRYFLILYPSFIQFIYDILNINKYVECSKSIEIPIDDKGNNIEYQFTLSKGFKDKHIKIKYDKCENFISCFDNDELRDTLFYTVDMVNLMVRNINHILAEYYALQEIK